MSFSPDLQIGQVISNERLTQIFSCSPQGGMRRSLRSNSLVITTETGALYRDYWHGDILNYTGMGLSGDQEMVSQNRTLAESNSNGVAVFLFEVTKPNHYSYRGQVRLGGDPFQEIQPDSTSTSRKVWMFPLKVINKLGATIEQDTINEIDAKNAAKAKRLSDDELSKRVQRSRSVVSQRITSTTYFERNPFVAEYALRRAQGYCQLCLQPAPFIKQDHTPYLESHHIIWLANGGPDAVDNTVALCPNCHRKMHVISDPNDVRKLQIMAIGKLI